MSATLVERPTATEVAASGAGFPRRLLADVVCLTALLLGVVFITDGWFSADEVVMRQQSKVLAQTSQWAVPPDTAALAVDPDLHFALLARSDRIGTEIAPYTKHPLVPIMVATGERIAGSRGRYLPGVAALLGASLLLAHRFDWSRAAFWLLAVGTTAFFHVSVLWAHAPALFFASLAIVLLHPAGRSPTAREIVLASVSVSIVALMRSEGLLLGAALSLSVGIDALRRSSRARMLAVGPLAASVLVYITEPILRSSVFGSGSTRLTPPASGSSGLTSRVDVARIMFIEPSVSGGLGSVRLLGALVLVAVSFGLRTGKVSKRPGRALLILSVGFYLLGALSSPIPGLVVAMPLLVACVPWIIQPAAEERRALTAAAAFALAVVASSYDNAGGGDWGARYLFIGVPLLAIAIVPAAKHMSANPDGKWVLVSAAVCALSVQVGVLDGVIGRSTTVETVDQVAATIEAHTSTDPQLVAAVSDERLSRFLYDRGVRGRVFHVPPGLEEQFLVLEAVRSSDRVLWVDLPDQAETRPGDVIETHGSVSIRTEVRR
ncbi:MAG: hypothetical protein ACN4GZ_13730 [Acidimicrobiales bacterium]